MTLFVSAVSALRHKHERVPAPKRPCALPDLTLTIPSRHDCVLHPRPFAFRDVSFSHYRGGRWETVSQRL